MTFQEAAQVLAMLARRYPQSKALEPAPGETVDAADTVRTRMWRFILRNIPYPAAIRAAEEWSTREKWFPDPAELREEALSILERCSSPEEREALDPGWTERTAAYRAPALPPPSALWEVEAKRRLQIAQDDPVRPVWMTAEQWADYLDQEAMQRKCNVPARAIPEEVPYGSE